MYRYRDFEVVLKDSKTGSPCQNSGEIPLTNINEMRRSATQSNEHQESDSEDTEDSEASDIDDIDDNASFSGNVRLNGSQQNQALSTIQNQLEKSTESSSKSVQYYVDTLNKKNILKDQYNSRLDLLYRIAESRNLPLEQVMIEAKKIQDEVYKEQ